MEGRGGEGKAGQIQELLYVHCKSGHESTTKNTLLGFSMTAGVGTGEDGGCGGAKTTLVSHKRQSAIRMGDL